MKIMTFNIQHGLDYVNKVIDLDLFAHVIAKYEADVCGLNEVRGEGPLVDYEDQTEIIGGKLGFSRYFGEAIKVDEANPYGNAIVSRYPFKAVETIPIPDPVDKSEPGYYESRCVIRAIVKIEGKEICFLVCHMGLVTGERKNAVATLCRLVDESTLPTIVMGDFNMEPEDELLLPLRERLRDTAKLDEGADKATFPSDAPRIKIDYIFYKGLECKRVETIKEVISDHLPIMAEFK